MLHPWKLFRRLTSTIWYVLGLRVAAEPDDPPCELSESLPDSDVYLLCSASGPKPLIRYASPGFKALFEVSAFQELSGCERLIGDQPSVADLSRRARLPCSDLRAGLRWLEERVAAAGRKVATGARFAQRDVAWVVRVTRDGRPIVCEVTFFLYRSEELGQDMLVAMHRDVSQEVPLHGLLLAAASGAGRSFTASLKEMAAESLYSRGPLLSSTLDAAESEKATPEKTRPQALQDALLECGRGPVSFQLTRDGVVGLKAPKGTAPAPPCKSNDVDGACSAVYVAVANTAPRAEHRSPDVFPYIACLHGFDVTEKEDDWLAFIPMPAKLHHAFGWQQAFTCLACQQTSTLAGTQLVSRKVTWESWDAMLWAKSGLCAERPRPSTLIWRLMKKRV